MIQTFEFSGARNIAASGTAFQYLRALDPTVDQRIDVYANGSAIATMEPGDDALLPQTVTQWELIPKASAQRGMVAVGQGRLRRLTTRYVLEPGIARTLMGLNFTAQHIHTAAAGQQAMILFEAQGVQVAVRHLMAQFISTGTMRFFRFTGSATAPLSQQPSRNKLGSGPAAPCRIVGVDVPDAWTPVVAGCSGFTPMGARVGINGSTVSYPGAEPFMVLQPNEGVAVGFTTPAATLIGACDFEVLTGISPLM